MFEELKKSDFRTLKTLTSLSLNRDKRETIKKELVKSYEEMAIANFYFINGIDYQYEKPYENNVSTIEKRQYTPDFYLPEANTFVEVKGLYREDALEKLVAFISENNEKDDYNIEIIDASDYAQLYAQFSNIIPNWEQHLQIPDQSNFT